MAEIFNLSAEKRKAQYVLGLTRCGDAATGSVKRGIVDPDVPVEAGSPWLRRDGRWLD